MKRALVSAALGIALLGAGAGGAYYYGLRQTPAPIRNACRLVNDAYTDANQLAEAEPEEHFWGHGESRVDVLERC